jgi:cold shock CspA family protein
MYNFSEQLSFLKKLGLVGIRILQVPNERPMPGEKTVGGTELAVRNNWGFVGTFNSRRKLTFALAVEIERRGDFHVVWTEGPAKEIKALGDQTPDAKTALLTKRIPTDTTLGGDFTTKSSDKFGNGVWVISTTDGQLQMWEAAIVTILTGGQARYYLSLQKVYAAAMFRCTIEDGADPIYVPEEQFPNYMDWSSLRSFLAKAVDVSVLKPLSEYQPELAEEPMALADGQAEVIWFNQAKGFGFAIVNGENPNPNFHRSQVRDQEFPAFQSGQIIRYDNLNRTRRGVQLMGVTEL